jgi:hypothetical protein
MRVVCAWCKKKSSDDGENDGGVSHGICLPCKIAEEMKLNSGRMTYEHCDALQLRLRELSREEDRIEARRVEIRVEQNHILGLFLQDESERMKNEKVHA